MSGARLVVTLLHELRRRGGRDGLATLCVGAGQGQAALFERPRARDASEPALRTPKFSCSRPAARLTYFGRPRLERILDAADERRLTSVVAGPGSGS